jgi:hypothetical protein
MKSRCIFWAAALLFWLPTLAWAVIEVPATSAPHKKITAVVKPTIPEGATYKGVWKLANCDTDIKSPDTLLIWAPPGKHVIEYRGTWVKTEAVEIPQADGTKKTIQALVDWGPLDEQAEFEVTGGAPPPDPQPQPTPGTKWAIIWRETEAPSPQLGNLFVTIRQKFPAGQVQIHDPSQLDPQLQALHQQLPAGQALPALMVVVRTPQGTDQVLRSSPLPFSGDVASAIAAIAKELSP